MLLTTILHQHIHKKYVTEHKTYYKADLWINSISIREHVWLSTIWIIVSSFINIDTVHIVSFLGSSHLVHFHRDVTSSGSKAWSNSEI